MSKVDDLVKKSLEELDSLADELGYDLQKGERPAPGEISDDNEAPEEPENEEPTGGEGAPEEGEEGEGVEGEGAEGTDGEGYEDNDEEVEKSLESELKSNDSVRRALEVSEFLGELVKGISKVIGDQNESIVKSIQSSEENAEVLAKSFQGMLKSQRFILETQGELSKSIASLTKRISKIESQPKGRKSVLNTVEKSFKASAGDVPTNAPASDKLSKAQVLDILSTAYESDKTRTDLMNDILAYESLGDMGVLSPAAKALISNKK